MGARAHGGIDAHHDGIAAVLQPMLEQGVVERYHPSMAGLTARETFPECVTWGWGWRSSARHAAGRAAVRW